MVGAALFEKHRSGAKWSASAICQMSCFTHTLLSRCKHGEKRESFCSCPLGVLFVILAFFLSSSRSGHLCQTAGDVFLSFFKTVTLLRFWGHVRDTEAVLRPPVWPSVCVKFCPLHGGAISLLPPAYTQTQLQGMGNRTVGNRLVFLKPQVIV